MVRFYAPLRARFAAFCWGVGALSCTDLAPPDNLSAGIGGQSGDGSGIGGQTGDGAGIAKIGVVQCPHKYSPWKGDLNDVVPELDLAPEDVLDTVETTLEESFEWVVNERLKIAETHTEVAVDLHYEAGEIRVRRPTEQDSMRTEVADLAPPSSYTSRASQYCGTVLEIELEATLSTADGALDESFSVVVTANKRGAAHFEGWLPQKLDGALGDDVDEKKHRLYVAAMLTPWGTSGEIVAISLPQNEEDDVGPAERIGGWPVMDPGVCVDSGYGTLITSTVPSDGGGALQAMFDALAPNEVPLTWNLTPAWPEACSPETSEVPACATTLHIEAANVAETWCAAVTPFAASFSASAPLELTVRTADEQWRGSYASSATLSVLQDGTKAVDLSGVQQGIVASGEALGFPNLQLTPDKGATLSFGITAGVSGSTGYVSVFGYPEATSDGDAGAPEAQSLIGASLGAPPTTP